MASRVAAGVYKRTFGSMFGMMASAIGYGDSNQSQTPEEQEAEKMAQAQKDYVCITFLERQADIFVRWVLKRGNLLMSK